MYEEGIRGGISSIMKRFAVANNSYLKNYNPDQPDSFIVYIDKNSLYPQAMRDYLPYSDFKWVDDVDNINIINVPSDAERGYILEVDLEYPSYLHNFHNQYPLAPEHYKPAATELSKYNDGHTNQKIKKLIPTLKDRSKYVLYYRNLQYYIMMGMKLTKIHRAISFNQSAWMLPYIEFCGVQRKNATSENEKTYWKLMMNSVFGKSIENVRERRRVMIVKEPREALKLISHNCFKHFFPFNEKIAAIELFKTRQC